MVWTWAGWEPLQFYRRLGGFHEAHEGNAQWADDWGRALRSPQTAKALAAAGVNWVTTHFYKGFGLKAEAEEMAQAAELIRNYHRHGVKVFTYIQYGTIMPETIELEVPQAARWGRCDWNGQHDGHPYEYGTQYWRRKPCANQPGFRDYLLRVIDHALDAGADGIWIDNLNADGCYCARCQAVFRQYVATRVKDPWRDLGLPPAALKRLTIPRSERPRDPLWQLWVRCRCDEVKTSTNLIAAHVRRCKPDVLVAANVGLGNHQHYIPENGNWAGNLDCLDYTYAENGLLPAWTGKQIVSQFFTAKLAEAAGTRIVPGAGCPGTQNGPYPIPGVPDAALLSRVFAESLFFGGHAAGGPWGLRGENGGGVLAWVRDVQLRTDNRRESAHFADWLGHVAGSRDVATVGVLYSFEAMGFDESPARTAFDAMVQLLRQHQIPCRLLLSDRVTTALEGLTLLILPHVLPISDTLASELRGFVKRGGRLLLTGRTGLYDEWFRQRRDYALADVLGNSFSNEFECAHQHDALVNATNGCIHIPGEWGLCDGAGQPWCRLQDTHLLQLIRETVAASGLPELVGAPPQVACEVRRTARGALLLGIINYGATPGHGLRLAWRTPRCPAPARVTVGAAAAVNRAWRGAGKKPGAWQLVLPPAATSCLVFQEP